MSLVNKNKGDGSIKGILKSEDELFQDSGDVAMQVEVDTSNSQQRQSEGGGGGGKRIKWDEDNLMAAECERGTRQKIIEPKTPYVKYDEDNDTVQIHRSSSGQWLPPLKLNEAALEQALANVAHHPSIDIDDKISVTSSSNNNNNNNDPTNRRASSRMSTGSNGGIMAGDTANTDSNHHHFSSSASYNEWDTTASEGENAMVDSDGDFIYIDASSAAEYEQKKKKFFKLRSQHYDMKNALRRGKDLLSTEDDDDDDAAENQSMQDDGSNGSSDSEESYGSDGDFEVNEDGNADPGRNNVSRSKSMTSASSQSSGHIRLFRDQPLKPALVKPQAGGVSNTVGGDVLRDKDSSKRGRQASDGVQSFQSSDKTGASSYRSRSTSSKRDKHVRIVDSRTKMKDDI
ncbi:hypothetical protein MP228_011939 [Amoeboaphelidium protococcarum]|nr:hypothetical protein MP228_011939 [Amoeboaphelidium protococcarum]